MKRKGFFIVGGIVIAIAITFMLVFVFSGNDKKWKCQEMCSRETPKI